MGMELPNEAQCAKKFLKGLGPEYASWYQMYKQLNSPALLTVTDAYAAASKVTPRFSTGRGGSRRGRIGGRSRGTRMAFATGSHTTHEENASLRPDQCLVCHEHGHRAGDKCPLVQQARALNTGDGYLVMKPNDGDKKPSASDSGQVERSNTSLNSSNKSVKNTSSYNGRGRGGRGRGCRGRGGRNNNGKFAAATYDYEEEDESDDYYYNQNDEEYGLYDDYEGDGEYEEYNDTSHTFVNIAFTTTQEKQSLKDTDVLLDAQSNINVFWNRNLLSNIVEADVPLRYGGQTGGIVTLTHYGDFMGIPKVWIDTTGKANLLCYKTCQNWLIQNKLGDIKEIRKDRLTIGWDMLINKEVYEFRCKMGGLHTCDMHDRWNKMAAVNLVSENRSNYSKRDVKKADEVTELLKNFNAIDEEKLKTMLNSSMISGCNLVGRDVTTRMDIEGPKFLPSLKGKSRGKKSLHVPFNPPEKRTTMRSMLHCDIMHWRGRTYLIAVVNPADYTMAKRIKHIDAESIRQEVLNFIKILRSRNISIVEIRSDPARQFLSGLKTIPGVRFNPKDPGSHEPVAENRIKTIKERLWANDFINKPIVTGSILIDHQVYYVIQRYNMELSNNRSDKGIPWVAVTGCQLNYKRELNLAFLDYVQATDRNAVKDKKPERTVGAIALHRMINDSGSWLFYSLSTKKTFLSNTWTKLPMPDVVFDILKRMANNQKSYESENDDADDRSKHKEPTYTEHIEEGEIEEPIVSVAGEDNNITGEENHLAGDHNHITGEDKTLVEEKTQTKQKTFDSSNISIPLRSDKKMNALKAVTQHPAFGGVRRRSERIRAKTGAYATTIHQAFANISMAEALKVRPDEAISAIKKELSGLHDMSKPDNPYHVWKPKIISELTSEEIKNIVPSSLFLKDKAETLKARIVVNEVESRVPNKAELDTSSPGVDFNAVLIAVILRMMNKMNVRRVFDVGQAYTKAKAKRNVHVRLNKKVSNILCEILPVYQQFVNRDGTIIVQLLQALYGTVDAGKLWYDEICGHLTSIGFKRNPYQLCVFNRKEKDGSTTALCLFVDDGKLLCDNDYVADEIVEHIEQKYGKLKIRIFRMHMGLFKQGHGSCNTTKTYQQSI